MERSSTPNAIPVNSVISDAIKTWLAQATARGASDLHVSAGYPPTIRLHGQLIPLDVPPLSGNETRDCLRSLLPDQHHSRLEQQRSVDFASELQLDGVLHRFRANYFYAADHLNACFRVIPNSIPDLDWAGFPVQLANKLTSFRNGLIIFCGATGAGKTTSLAMIIQMMREQCGFRIVTIEEPIEYEFPKSVGSMVTQREVGRDVGSFDEGLKSSLRQDPDVILVGEIRDRETARTALRAAETGHLVFATLHTRDAKGAVSRYTDLFSQESQQEVRSQLSSSLRAVVCQHLIPSAYEQAKRVLALEVMFNNSPVAIAIRQGRMDNIDNTILTSRAEGMITLSESIRRLYQDGQITMETAERYSADSSFLRA
jgi:twitching motility protein PilT